MGEGIGRGGRPLQPPPPRRQPVPSHPSCPLPCGAGRLGYALVGCSPEWAARGVRADATRGHQREQSGMGGRTRAVEKAV